MGRSSSTFIFLALFSASSSVAADARSTESFGANGLQGVGSDTGTRAIVAQDYGDALGPDAGPGGAPYLVGEPVAEPPPFAFGPPPPCIRPMIIQIGRGLAHAARTRIIYGARPPCG